MNVLNSLNEQLDAPSRSGAVSPRAVGWYWLRMVTQDLTSPGRAAVALFVVFLLLATTGWTVNRHGDARSPQAVALSAWLHGSINAHRLPRPGAPPSAIAHFFSALTSPQRIRLADRYPQVVGNLNGAPARLRYRANRRAIDQALREERRRARTAALTEAGQREATERAHVLESLLRPGRQILAFNPEGRGQVAEVFGDLSAAQRISVLVPGSDTDLLSFERRTKSRTAPVGMARSLYRAQRATDPDMAVATIAWADYRTPEGLGMDAATGALAENGADRLRSLVGALPAGASATLFCHSYGSVVCGMAAPELPPGKVSDIAVFGSPGMRVDRAKDLGTDVRVWAARDPSDWIRDVPHLEFAGLGHGSDPVSPAFGARVITADDARGHAGYFEPGTASLRNFTRLALGEYASVRCASGSTCTAGLA